MGFSEIKYNNFIKNIDIDILYMQEINIDILMQNK